jgi:hypothetical protein
LLIMAGTVSRRSRTFSRSSLRVIRKY